jgi:hypothetical protein
LGDFFLALARSVKVLQAAGFDNNGFMVSPSPVDPNGHGLSERNAIVIDRFFDAKEKALAWAKANPHFVMVRVGTPDTEAA